MITSISHSTVIRSQIKHLIQLYSDIMAPLGEVCKMLIGQAFGKTWIPDIDFTGKTMVVTGANTGLGLECVKHL